MYTLLSKSIYFHPPGTKPSLKHLELIRNPEKPLPTACSSISLHCRSLLIAALSFFGNHSDLFQLGSVSKGKWCITHFSPTLYRKWLSLLLSLFFSLVLCHSQLRAAPLPNSKAGAWRKLLQSAQIPPRDRQKKVSEDDKAGERRRQLERRGEWRTGTHAHKMPTMLTLQMAYPLSLIFSIMSTHWAYKWE